MQLDISHDPARLDRAMILHFLTTRAHWANGMDAALLERAIRHSLIIAAYHQGRQIGFARVITDYASFAYLSMYSCYPTGVATGGPGDDTGRLAHPHLQQLRRFCWFHAMPAAFTASWASRPCRRRALQRDAATAAAVALAIWSSQPPRHRTDCSLIRAAGRPARRDAA
jgi:hypothetical protein